jgi:tryptophanyl-tRNA synthetase
MTGHTRRLSLLTPSGHLTLGNHLGALRGMVATQPETRGQSFYLSLYTTPSPRDNAATRMPSSA